MPKGRKTKTNSMKSIYLLLIALLFIVGCGPKPSGSESTADVPDSMALPTDDRIPVIFDTDANNELDDQHAIAYLLFNDSIFNILGVTVNATHGGGPVANHYREAKRVLTLCNRQDVPLLTGADKNFINIRDSIEAATFDGSDAVNFITDQSQKIIGKKLTIIAVGKLTTVALALAKDPSLAGRARIVWLGSNYPAPGEYNQDEDTVAMNYVLNSLVDFEMVTVRYGERSGTDAVRVMKSEMIERMKGKGPHATTPIEGRHGGSFSTFGDYSINLFEHIEYYDNPPSRALFDMVAVAVVKNPSWGEQKEIPAPILIDNKWTERTDNPHHITVWENFNKKEILADYFDVIEHSGDN